jgi:signal transduction histidine kinase
VLYGVAIIALIYLYLYLQFKQRLAQARASHLEEIDLAKTRLYTNISHEFRTPITSRTLHHRRCFRYRLPGPRLL